MKNFLFIITFLYLISTDIFSQGSWLPTELPFYIGIPTWIFQDANYERISIFSNKYGIHVLQTKQLTSTNYDVKYYRLKTDGSLDGSQSSNITLDNAGNFPNICGNDNLLYVIYYKVGKIKTQISSDGTGSSWSDANIPDIDFQTGSDFSSTGVDAIYDKDYGLNIVWSEKVGSQNEYESYYSRYLSPNWTQPFNITNTTTPEFGGMPTISLSNYGGVKKIHVAINTGHTAYAQDNTGLVFSRDYNFDEWTTPIPVLPGNTFATIGRIFSKGDYVHYFYHVLPTKNTPAFLKYRRKTVASSDWGSLDLTVDADVNFSYVPDWITKIPVVQTPDNILHVFYYRAHPDFGLVHRQMVFDGTSWSSPITSISLGGSSFHDAIATSTSNDIYVLWTFRGPYQYRYFDAAPFTPQNLSISVHTVPGGQYPKLNWTLNNEPDVRINDDGYLIERRTRISNDPWSEWLPNGTATGDASEFIDYDINTAGSGFNDAEYKIAANDLNNNASPFSSSVQIEYGHLGWEKKALTSKPTEYLLEQNFPNPFNPTTKISYQISIADHVSLKVFDILGNEVATLVNEEKSAGFYEVEFNANDFSSGMYFYKLETGKFTSGKWCWFVKLHSSRGTAGCVPTTY